MSKTACCHDNESKESFFHSLKVELFHQQKWATREDAKCDFFQYIEGVVGSPLPTEAILHRIIGCVPILFGYNTPEQAERSMT